MSSMEINVDGAATAPTVEVEAGTETGKPEAKMDGSAEKIEKSETGAEKSAEKTDSKTKDDRPPLAEHDSSVLDLAFAMDCTGSMGSYIKTAQSNIRHIVEEIVSTEKSDIHLALVEYRDHPPQENTFVTRVLDFTPSVSKMKKRLDACAASGGGDTPEAVADALHQVSKLSWRKNATKICVFISDAPPHGLSRSGDSFPNGCPDNLDPMEITGAIAQKGITMYMVGCEPSISRYRDFFMTIAHMTGGQYVPLANAQLLSKVIIGGAQEEITLERLMQNAQQQVQRDVLAMGGWDAYGDREEEMAEQVMSRVNAMGFKSKQLQMRGSSLPEASAKAKKWSNMKKMSDVKAEYMATEDLVEPRIQSCAAPKPMSATKSTARKKSGGLGSLFRRSPMSAAVPPPPMSSDTFSSEAPTSLDDYTLTETEGIDRGQAKRMLQKMQAQQSTK